LLSVASVASIPGVKHSIGFVYWATDGERVKIGYSACPWGRVQGLQAASPAAALQIVALSRGTYADERLAHQRFATKRIHGEWFRFDADMQAESVRIGICNDPDSQVRLTIRLPMATYRTLARLAKNDNRFVTDYVRLVVTNHVEVRKESA
jgi:hypothetical protein